MINRFYKYSKFGENQRENNRMKRNTEILYSSNSLN